MRTKTILLLSFLTLVACRHDVSVQPPPPPTVTPNPLLAPTFGISGDTAVAVMQGRAVNVSFSLFDSGAARPVTISFSGLPAGVIAVWTTNRITPPGQATLRIIAGPSPTIGVGPYPVAPVGTFVATVLAKMDSGAEKTRSISVTVAENPNCLELRIGTYKKYGCLGSSDFAYVTVDPAQPGTRIRISNFPYLGKQFYAEVNCADNTIMIPSQSAGNLRTYAGTGTFSRDTIMGTGVYDNSGGVVPPTDTCDFILVRQ